MIARGKNLLIYKMEKVKVESLGIEGISSEDLIENIKSIYL